MGLKRNLGSFSFVLRRSDVDLPNELTKVFSFNGANVRTEVINGNPMFVAKDICDALGLDNRNTKKVLEEDEVYSIHLTDTTGRTQEMLVVNEAGMYSLVLRSRKPEAKQFKRWITHEVLPAIRKTGHYETPEYKALMQLQEQQNLLIEMRQEDKRIIDELSTVIKSSIWSEPVTNPRYDFELYNAWYKDSTKDASQRGIFEAVGDYFGIHVPFSSEVKPITLTQWLIEKVTLDEIKRFVIGIKKGYIVKNSFNHWVNLNGFGSNNVEFQKVVREFGNQCAYCSNTEAVLIPEHIVSQTEMSTIDPTKVDIINNITCSCGECNGSKGSHDMEQWFRRQPFFSIEKLKKIKRHQVKYEI